MDLLAYNATMTSSLELLDETGTKIEKKQKPVKTLPPRYERRRMRRDEQYHNKVIAGNPGVPVYNRMMAYGQLLIHQLTDIQQRMAGVPFARGRRPAGMREELSEQLTIEWNDCVEKLGEVQEQMQQIETIEDLKENPHKEADVYGLC